MEDMRVRQRMEIDRDALLLKLAEVRTEADEDLARMLELLLLENHVLKKQVSSGLLRSISLELKSYPRFIDLVKVND